jgi:hypothetical protein
MATNGAFGLKSNPGMGKPSQGVNIKKWFFHIKFSLPPRANIKKWFFLIKF